MMTKVDEFREVLVLLVSQSKAIISVDVAEKMVDSFAAIARTEGVEEAIRRIRMLSDDGINQFGGMVMRGKTTGDNAVYIVPASVLAPREATS